MKARIFAIFLLSIFITSVLAVNVSAECGFFCRLNQVITGKVVVQQLNCIDSDGGLNYNVKGECKDAKGNIMKDYCEVRFLKEYYRGDYGSCSSISYQCPNGCQDGACLAAPAPAAKPDLIVESIIISQSTAQPSGIVGIGAPNDKKYIITVKNIGNAPAVSPRISTAITPTQKQGIDMNTINFFYADYSGTPGASVTKKDRGTTLEVGEVGTWEDYFTPQTTEIGIKAIADSDYQVVESDETNNELTKKFTFGNLCQNSDGGKNYYLKGAISGTDSFGTKLNVAEKCLDNKTLNECYCNEESYECVKYSCSDICKDGACYSTDVLLKYNIGTYSYLWTQSETDSDYFFSIAYYRRTGETNEVGASIRAYFLKENIKEGLNTIITESLVNVKKINYNGYIIYSGKISGSDMPEYVWTHGSYILSIHRLSSSLKDPVEILDEYLSAYPSDIEEQACTDSDGGINYYVKSITKGVYGSPGGISYKGITYNEGDYVELEDFCDNNFLHEYSCFEKGVTQGGLSCPYGCVDGACAGTAAELTITKCDRDRTCDSSYVSVYEGKIVSLIDEKGNRYQLSVSVASDGSGAKLIVNGVTQSVVEDGSYAWESLGFNVGGINPYGVTVPASISLSVGENYNTCPDDCAAAQPVKGCTDTDGGEDIYTKGYCQFVDAKGIVYGPNYDKCSDENYVEEAECNEVGSCYGRNLLCPNGCQDGVCLSTEPTGTCTEDSDKEYTCPDGNNILWCKCFGEKWTCIDNPAQYCAGYKPSIGLALPQACDGCLVNGKCLRIGQRVKGNYCSLDGNMISQMEKDEACDENYECLANTCVSGKCVDQYGLIVKTWCYLKCAGVVAKEFLTFGPQAGKFFEPCVLSCLEKY